MVADMTGLTCWETDKQRMTNKPDDMVNNEQQKKEVVKDAAIPSNDK